MLRGRKAQNAQLKLSWYLTCQKLPKPLLYFARNHGTPTKKNAFHFYIPQSSQQKPTSLSRNYSIKTFNALATLELWTKYEDDFIN